MMMTYKHITCSITSRNWFLIHVHYSLCLFSQCHVVGVRHLEFTYLFQLMFRPMETKGHEDVEYTLSVVG
ncbi:hypothetical protein BDV30DRAFT_108347 [Aspergillus minisclerotigenes]|uniref:Uncharacterized protein n=1 Tax=Aspergillus minisclerotigenes TaxID=656917 RepID=A0A5N6J5I0_9EURO|nr:hypothetical protein BDV30DRAFT_108347 [Aspergillus minisclerotigenes]